MWSLVSVRRVDEQLWLVSLFCSVNLSFSGTCNFIVGKILGVPHLLSPSSEQIVVSFAVPVGNV